MFTREILSWDKTLPAMKSSMSMAECLFICFRRGKISARGQLKPVKNREMKIHPGGKNKKKCVNISPRNKILQWAWFYLIFVASTHHESYKNDIVEPVYKEWIPKNHYNLFLFVKFAKDWNYSLKFHPWY